MSKWLSLCVIKCEIPEGVVKYVYGEIFVAVKLGLPSLGIPLTGLLKNVQAGDVMTSIRAYLPLNYYAGMLWVAEM